MQKKKERLLTEVELELMSIVWRLGKCVVREVLEALPEGRDVTYTSVAKIMKILEDKGVLASEKKEKTHLFYPLLSREEYEKRTLRHMTERLFEGSLSSMVLRLLDDSDLTTEELREIRRSLDERLSP